MSKTLLVDVDKKQFYAQVSILNYKELINNIKRNRQKF